MGGVGGIELDLPPTPTDPGSDYLKRIENDLCGSTVPEMFFLLPQISTSEKHDVLVFPGYLPYRRPSIPFFQLSSTFTIFRTLFCKADSTFRTDIGSRPSKVVATWHEARFVGENSCQIPYE